MCQGAWGGVLGQRSQTMGSMVWQGWGRGRNPRGQAGPALCSSVTALPTSYAQLPCRWAVGQSPGRRQKPAQTPRLECPWPCEHAALSTPRPSGGPNFSNPPQREDPALNSRQQDSSPKVPVSIWILVAEATAQHRTRWAILDSGGHGRRLGRTLPQWGLDALRSPQGTGRH